MANASPTKADATRGAAGNPAGAIPTPITVPCVQRYRIRVRLARTFSKRADPRARPNNTIMRTTPPHKPTLPAKPVILPPTTSPIEEASSISDPDQATGRAKRPRIAAQRGFKRWLTPRPNSTGRVVVKNNSGKLGGGATFGKIAPMFKKADRCAHKLTMCDMVGITGNNKRVSTVNMARRVV